MHHASDEKNGIQIPVLRENSFSDPVNKISFFLENAYVSKSKLLYDTKVLCFVQNLIVNKIS